MFAPIFGGRWSKFDLYFSNGLKPPTSSVLVFEYGNFVVSIHDVFRVFESSQLFRRILEHNITTGQIRWVISKRFFKGGSLPGSPWKLGDEPVMSQISCKTFHVKTVQKNPWTYAFLTLAACHGVRRTVRRFEKKTTQCKELSSQSSKGGDPSGSL